MIKRNPIAHNFIQSFPPILNSISYNKKKIKNTKHKIVVYICGNKFLLNMNTLRSITRKIELKVVDRTFASLLKEYLKSKNIQVKELSLKTDIPERRLYTATQGKTELSTEEKKTIEKVLERTFQ